MKYLMCRIMSWHGSRDRGATAVEYGLMVALIAVVIMGTVGLLGKSLDGLFKEVLDELDVA